jgi:hypothetical protein
MPPQKKAQNDLLKISTTISKQSWRRNDGSRNHNKMLGSIYYAERTSTNRDSHCYATGRLSLCGLNTINNLFHDRTRLTIESMNAAIHHCSKFIKDGSAGKINVGSLHVSTMNHIVSHHCGANMRLVKGIQHPDSAFNYLKSQPKHEKFILLAWWYPKDGHYFGVTDGMIITDERDKSTKKRVPHIYKLTAYGLFGAGAQHLNQSGLLLKIFKLVNNA